MTCRFVLVALALTAPALAAPEHVLSVQGALSSAAGLPYSGPVDLTVRLADTGDSGGLVWEEDFENLDTPGGVFSLHLGEGAGLPPAVSDGRPIWVEIEADGQLIGARRPIQPVLFALWAARAESAAALDCDGCISTSQLAPGSVTAADVAFNFAASASAGGAAANLECSACVSSTEVDFVYAGAATPGGAATDSDKLDGHDWNSVPETTERWVDEAGDTMTGALNAQGGVAAPSVDFVPQAAAPTGQAGRTYFDGGTKALLVHDGAAWAPVGLALPKGAIMFSETPEDPNFLNNGFAPVVSALRLAEGWSVTRAASAPSARYHHTATWTGKYVFIYGGQSSGSSYATAHARYRPATDTWATVTTTGQPNSRAIHTAVWTGKEVIVWGGRSYNGASTVRRNDGARYDPEANKWTALPATAPTIAAREQHMAVWTGKHMIVWGGYAGSDATVYDDGLRYDPATNQWSTMFQGPSKRFDASAVWTGTQMIVWGGASANNVYLKDGAAYDPVANVFAGIAAAPVELVARRGHSAVWTGTEMIVFGGTVGAGTVPDKVCAAYNPTTNQWRVIDTSTVAESRAYHAGVWTGKYMVLWGGNNGTNSYVNTGDLYDPEADLWTPMNAINAPTARYTWPVGSVWAQDRLVVWGGYNGAAIGTGGVYDPGLTLYPYKKL